MKGSKAEVSLDHSQKHPEHSFHSTMPENKGEKPQFLYKINQNLGINKMLSFIFSSPKYYKIISLYQNQKGITFCSLVDH